MQLKFLLEYFSSFILIFDSFKDRKEKVKKNILQLPLFSFLSRCLLLLLSHFIFFLSLASSHVQSGRQLPFSLFYSVLFDPDVSTSLVKLHLRNSMYNWHVKSTCYSYVCTPALLFRKTLFVYFVVFKLYLFSYIVLINVF